MITLWESEYASQIEIARSFGYSERSLRRYQERFESGGISGLIRGPGRPSGGSKNAKERGRDQTILHLKAKGASNRTIAGKLGLSEKAIRKRLRRLGWRPNPEPAESSLLFQEQTNGDAFPSPAVSDPPMDNPAPESAAASATPLARSEDIESWPFRPGSESVRPEPGPPSGRAGPAPRCRTSVRACRQSSPSGCLAGGSASGGQRRVVRGSQDLRHNRPSLLRTTHDHGHLHSLGITENPSS